MAFTPPSDAVEAEASFTPPSDAQEVTNNTTTPEESSGGKAFAKGAAKSVVPGLAGLAGMGAGASLGATIGAVGGPVGAGVGGFVGGLTGAVVGSAAMAKIQDAVWDVVPEEWQKMVGADKATREKEQREHPTLSAGGEIVGGLAGASPFTAASKATTVIGKALASNAAQRGVSGVLQGGLDVGMQAGGDRPIDWKQTGMATVAGVAMPGLNVAGKALAEKGGELGGKLVAAIRDRNTGKVSPAPEVAPDAESPKADPNLEPGYIDEKGKFFKNLDTVKEAKVNETIKVREDNKAKIKDLESSIPGKEQEADILLSKGDEVGAAALNKELEDIANTTRILREELPPPVIADKAFPTAKEIHDLLWDTRTVGEASKILLDSDVGAKGQRELLKLIQEHKLSSSAKLELVSKLSDSAGSKLLGEYDPNVHGVKISADGGALNTFIHESFHPAIEHLATDTSSPQAQQLVRLYKHAQEKFFAENFAKEWKDFQAGKMTAGELADHASSTGLKTYGFTNPREFLLESYASDGFRKILSTIDSPEPYKGKTIKAYQYIKELIKDALGIEGKAARSAMDDAMDLGGHIIDSTKDQTFYPGKFEGKPSPSKSVEEGAPKKYTPEELVARNVTSKEDFEAKALYIDETQGRPAAEKFFDEYQKYKETWIEAVRETEDTVGVNLVDKLRQERVIHNNTEKMKELVPNPVDRETVSLAIDNGKTGLLTGEMKELADKYTAAMTDIGSRAKEKGVIKGTLENYVSHIVNWEGAPKGLKEEIMATMFGSGAGRDPSMSGIATTSKFGKHRAFETFADLQVRLDEINEYLARKGASEWRLEIKTKDIAEIYKQYASSMEKAIINKTAITKLKQIRNVAGEALIRPITKEDPLPYGWESGIGSELAGHAIHPDLMPSLQFMFDAGPGGAMKALGNISQVVKRLNVVGSFFHAKSLMEVLSSTGIPIWTPVKEVTLGGVDKLLGTKFSGITKAVDQFRKGGLGDNVDAWYKAQLQLEVAEDVSRTILSDTGKLADMLIGKFGPKTRAVERTMSAVEKHTLGYFDKFTWDFLHTGGKLFVADNLLTKARIQAEKQGKPFNEDTARLEIARFVNDAFGGLNWFDVARQAQSEFGKKIAMAAYSPQGRRAAQVVMFAPDWTTSTVRSFVSALPESMNPLKWHPVEGAKGMISPTTRQDYARLYQFKTAITYFTLLNAINMMTAGRPIWENKDKSRIEWPDGTSMQAMKHAMEPYHWIADPASTLSNKLGFVPKAAVIGLTGLEYVSPHAQKLTDPSAIGRAKAIAEMALPFQVQAAKAAPEGEGTKRALLGTAGFPVYGKTKEQAKEARAKREKILKQKAKEYHQNEKRLGRE